MPACPASFLEERFPTSGNDATCAIIYDAVYGKEVNGMKKPLSKKALFKEAAFWGDLKKTAKENPGKTCLK
jgi:hypothetical protein